MNRFPTRPALIVLAVTVGLYAVLFQVMRATRMIEKVMALTFSWWEFLLILAFLVTRILSYLLVPSVLAAVAVDGVLAGRRGRRSDWSEEYRE